MSWTLILQGRIPKAFFPHVWKVCSCPCQFLVVWNTSSFSQFLGLLAAETSLTEHPAPEPRSFLREREVEAGLHLTGFYSGLVLQVSHQPQSHPPVEQPSFCGCSRSLRGRRQPDPSSLPSRYFVDT